VITDQDLENIDFPLICETIKVDALSSFLPEELSKKLNLLTEHQKPLNKEEEEKKQGAEGHDDAQ